MAKSALVQSCRYPNKNRLTPSYFLESLMDRRFKTAVFLILVTSPFLVIEKLMEGCNA